MLVNGSLAANASCTISLDLQVTATTAGSLTSPAVTLSSNQAPNATAAAINLTVTVLAPTFTMAFVPNQLNLNLANQNPPPPVTGNGMLTFTIANNAAITLTNLAFNHTLPVVPPLTVVQGPPPNPSPSTTCTGANLTVMTVMGVDTIQFTGGQLPPGQICTVDIPVQTAPLGQAGTYDYSNSSVTLNSAQAAPVTAGPVTWTVVVN